MSHYNRWKMTKTKHKLKVDEISDCSSRRTMTSWCATVLPPSVHIYMPACSGLALRTISPFSRVKICSAVGDCVSTSTAEAELSAPRPRDPAGVNRQTIFIGLVASPLATVAHSGGRRGRLQLMCNGAPESTSVLTTRYSKHNIKTLNIYSSVRQATVSFKCHCMYCKLVTRHLLESLSIITQVF